MVILSALLTAVASLLMWSPKLGARSIDHWGTDVLKFNEYLHDGPPGHTPVSLLLGAAFVSCLVELLEGEELLGTSLIQFDLASLRTDDWEAHSAVYWKVLLTVQALLRNEAIFVCF